MLAKANRLPSPRMREVMRSGRRFSYENLLVVVEKNNLNIPRFGFIVGAKVDKRATVRNRLKRLLREAVRLNLKEIVTGVDAIVSVKGQLTPLSQSYVSQLVKELFSRAGIWRAT